MAGTGTDTDVEYGAPAQTLLVLRGMGVTPYSARGMTQTLTHISAAASLRRTVNGELLDLSVPELRKYASTITCEDQDVPALDDVWPGQELEVDCVIELAYKVGGTAARLEVPGSERTADDFVFYRPRLAMRVITYQEEKDEYGAIARWTLSLEEI